jgi:hypothetical protein
MVSSTDSWTGNWENPQLLQKGKNNTFYYDGKINIWF